MEKTPYHHLPDGSFRNPEGSPVRNSNFKWSFKVFNKDVEVNEEILGKAILDKEISETDFIVLKNFSEHELDLPNYVLTVAVVNNLDVLYRINEL